jgi:hypothetical protein
VLQGPPPEAPEHGQVRVTFGTGAERTAAPRLDQFSKIELTFVRKDGTGTLSPVTAQGGAAVISLSPGTWDITASAYNNASPPLVAARAVNTLTRAGDTITGNTHFALVPAGTGPGILRCTVAPPQGIILDGTLSRIQIEKDGEVLAGLNSGGFNAGIRPIGAALTGAELSLEPGRYVVDIVLDDSAGANTAVYREAVALLPGLVTEIAFTPLAGDFLDPDARATLVQTNGKFRKTANDSSQTTIMDTGGGEINKTQMFLAPDNTETVYFTLGKPSGQSVDIGGRDAERVSQAARNSTVDGSTASATLAVFTVDTRDIVAAGGRSREFTLTLRESGKTPVTYAVTLIVGYHLTHLHVDAWPSRRVYVTGESFDPTGLVLQGLYSDETREPISDGWTVEGFDTTAMGEKVVTIRKQGIQAIQYGVLNGVFQINSPGQASFAITVVAPDVRDLFFDYGKRRSPLDTQPDRYSVPLGRTLVLAPVKWHIPDSAVYEWRVDNALQTSDTEYLSFTPNTQKTYSITVKAIISATEFYTASTTVECVAPEGTYKRSTSGERAAEVYEIVHSPGQFVNIPTWGTGELGGLSLGAWGGYVVYQFDHSVEKGSGRELRIGGNAFGVWNEPGIVWVLQDENGNGLPDDTWYELKGSHTLIPQTKRRYAVTYTKEASRVSWKDNFGGIGILGGWPSNDPSPMTFVGTGLPGPYSQSWSGYVDVVDTPLFSLSNAIQVDGTPVNLSYIDFVKVQTSLNVWADVFGEISTEILDLPEDVGGSPDPNSIIEGLAAAGGQYNYRFVNSSGYALTIAFNGAEFSLAIGATANKTSPNASEYVYYWGGNVDMTRSPGTATFADRPD